MGAIRVRLEDPTVVRITVCSEVSFAYKTLLKTTFPRFRGAPREAFLLFALIIVVPERRRQSRFRRPKEASLKM